MLSILINAYACSPNMGSEPGMAWNWCVNLARNCELHIITEGEFRDQIEAVVPTLPQGKNMHFYYNPVSDKIRKMCWNQGDWRFYKHYRAWQWKTYLIACEVISNHHIDIMHQLNMIGFREPGYLWKIEEKPLVWGPVDAKEKFPVAYLQGESVRTQLFIRLKNLLTSLQFRYSTRISKAAHKASAVVVASSESKRSFKKFFGIDAILLNETGCYSKQDNVLNMRNEKIFNLLWVGKMDFRKQLALAIKTVAKINSQSVRLHIVGGGDTTPYKQLANNLGITNKCVWHGMMSHDEVQQIMQQSDVFFFTSVAEGTPHVVLEAIGNNLPVVCFDVCGQGDSVNDTVGLKIPLSNPQQSVMDFAAKLDYLFSHTDVLHNLSANCNKRRAELSWENKAMCMENIYNRIR